jgi:peptide/nickel transport system ATP-binding protein
VADPANPPAGCYFHPRCRYAEDICRTQAAPLREIQPGHCVRCHLAEQLKLEGV